MGSWCQALLPATNHEGWLRAYSLALRNPGTSASTLSPPPNSSTCQSQPARSEGVGSLMLLQDHLAQSPHSAGGKMGLNGAHAKTRPVFSLSYRGHRQKSSAIQETRLEVKVSSSTGQKASTICFHVVSS